MSSYEGEEDFLISSRQHSEDNNDHNEQQQPEYVIVRLDEAVVFPVPTNAVVVVKQEDPALHIPTTSAEYDRGTAADSGTRILVEYNRPGLYGQDLVALSGAPIPLTNPNSGKHPYVCGHPYCSYSSPRINNFHRHVSTTHGTTDRTRSWSCCGLALRNLGEMNLHKALAHVTGDQRGDSLAYFCGHCQFIAKRKPDLVRHEKKHFPEEACIGCPSPGCGYASTSKSNVKRHLVSSCGRKKKKKGGGEQRMVMRGQDLQQQQHQQHVMTTKQEYFQQQHVVLCGPLEEKQVRAEAYGQLRVVAPDEWYHHHQLQQQGPSSSDHVVQMYSPPPTPQMEPGISWELHQDPAYAAPVLPSGADFGFKTSPIYHQEEQQQIKLINDPQMGAAASVAAAPDDEEEDEEEIVEKMLQSLGDLCGKSDEINSFLDDLPNFLELPNMVNLPF